MNKIVITVEKDKLLKLEYYEGRAKKKGFVDPEKVEEVIDSLKKILFTKDRYMYNDEKVNWNLIAPYTVATDLKTSIIYFIKEDTYYIPFVNGKEETIFKITYPNLICIYSKGNVYIYWTDDEYEMINQDTKLYKLEMPHLYNDGRVCKGSFKEDIDFLNPKKYFVDLITFPVSHSHEAYMLRNADQYGYNKNRNYSTTLRNLINLL